MFSVPHLVVLFIVVLVFFGPHKLPELARGLGKLMAEFRKASNDFKMAFEEEMRNIERQNREAEWKKSEEAAEAKRKADLASANSVADGSSDPKILPEHSASAGQGESPAESLLAEVLDPVVSPVSEAVARDSESAAPEDTALAVPAEEVTSSDVDAHNNNDVPADTPSASQPSHDHRQPA